MNRIPIVYYVCCQTDPRNYFYEISNTLGYAFVVKPIEILVQCPNKKNVIQLTKNQYFEMKSECQIFKKSDLHLNNSKLMTLDISVNSMKPNFSIGIRSDPSQREKIEVFREHRQAFEKIYNDLSMMDRIITFKRHNIDRIRETSTNFFGDVWLSIKFFFSNTISQYVFNFLGVLIGIYLCLCLTKIICRKMCSTK